MVIKERSTDKASKDLVECTPGTENMVVTSEQRKAVLSARELFRSNLWAVFIVLSHDEEDLCGCLATGRGLVHINTLGAVEPCAFRPCFGANLTNTSLRNVLSSDTLRRIRDSNPDLKETLGGLRFLDKQNICSRTAQT